MPLEVKVEDLSPRGAASLVANLGFRVSADLPDRPGPAYLVLALRGTPTLRHYDPEVVQYWATSGGRGVRRMLTRDSTLPADGEFSWGLIRIVDRLKVTNEYLGFGGRVACADVDGDAVIVFTSPAPLLRRGGHSQGWDHGAECAGAFFARLLVAVDFVLGFEARLSAAAPLARYSAFLADLVDRYRHSADLRASHQELWGILTLEEHRLRTQAHADWDAGRRLLRDVPG